MRGKSLQKLSSTLELGVESKLANLRSQLGREMAKTNQRVACEPSHPWISSFTNSI